MTKHQNIIIALLIVVVCALSFITYQQQNYIESLSQSVRESDAPTKKIVRRIQNVEGEVDSNKAALDELDRRVSDLEGDIDDIGNSAPSIDYYSTTDYYDLKKKIESVESDLSYLRSQLKRY